MPAPREHEVEPHPALRPWVSAIGVVQSDVAPVVDALFPPSAAPAILARWSTEGEVVIRVLGPLTRARRKSICVPRLYVRVVLRPGSARALLGAPLHTLADRIVPLEELGAERAALLHSALQSVGESDAVEALQCALAESVPTMSASLAPRELLLRAMHQLDTGKPQVAGVAREAGLSARHLRRLFLDEIGMTPKLYARVVRLGRALALEPRTGSWSDVAQEVGFHDQSHLIREFRDLLQTTPQAFRRFEHGADPTLGSRGSAGRD